MHLKTQKLIANYVFKTQGERLQISESMYADNCSEDLFLYRFIAQLIARVDPHATPANESQANRTRAIGKSAAFTFKQQVFTYA